jgi:hypothetical protein
MDPNFYLVPTTKITQALPVTLNKVVITNFQTNQLCSNFSKNDVENANELTSNDLITNEVYLRILIILAILLLIVITGILCILCERYYLKSMVCFWIFSLEDSHI